MAKKYLEGNRDRMEIIGNILNLANGGSMRTSLRRGVGLDMLQLDSYLGYLESRGFLTKSYEKYVYSANENPKKSRREKLFYRTTEKGLAYLHCYNSMMHLLEGDGRRTEF
jgi:predicted transcriptional regulator